MASSEGILGMMVNPLRFHLHPFPVVIQMLWRYSIQDILLPKFTHKNPCRKVSDFRLLGFYISVYCKKIFYYFQGSNVKISLKYNMINNFSFSVNFFVVSWSWNFLSFFLSSFLSYSDCCYLVTAGVDCYCCKCSHSMTQTHKLGRTPLDEGSATRQYPEMFFHLNNRCRYQSITQQYLKRCLIKDANNYIYMFRPIAAIISFSSESMVIVFYRIGMVMSRWWDFTTVT